MLLMNKLKADNLQARKNRDELASNLLSSLVGEAAMVGKNNGNRETTDEEALKVIKKFLDNAKELKELLLKNGASENRVTCDWQPIDGVNREIRILEEYMPAQMDINDLRTVINLFKTDNPGCNIGAIMKHLQTFYAGRYDGKLASQIAKE